MKRPDDRTNKAGPNQDPEISDSGGTIRRNDGRRVILWSEVRQAANVMGVSPKKLSKDSGIGYSRVANSRDATEAGGDSVPPMLEFLLFAYHVQPEFRTSDERPPLPFDKWEIGRGDNAAVRAERATLRKSDRHADLSWVEVARVLELYGIPLMQFCRHTGFDKRRVARRKKDNDFDMPLMVEYVLWTYERWPTIRTKRQVGLPFDQWGLSPIWDVHLA